MITSTTAETINLFPYIADCRNIHNDEKCLKGPERFIKAKKYIYYYFIFEPLKISYSLSDRKVSKITMTQAVNVFLRKPAISTNATLYLNTIIS